VLFPSGPTVADFQSEGNRKASLASLAQSVFKNGSRRGAEADFGAKNTFASLPRGYSSCDDS